MRLAGQVLVVAGAALMFLAGVGVMRLPDVFARLHASTKASSLGLASVLVGTIFTIPGWSVTVKLVLAMLFQFATAPVAAHVIGRAAHRAGIPAWEGTLFDELQEEPAPTGQDEPHGGRD
ncbi:MAG TPA: monovalent cation/H(+) antiporter subunit G [Actinomycetota bacterium]|nr:monovalent cation/H(+) antiporter subunit G [Actinomycetota bacterium]